MLQTDTSIFIIYIKNFILFLCFQLGLGVFFKMQENGHSTEGLFSYLPILSMILFYFCQASGKSIREHRTEDLSTDLIVLTFILQVHSIYLIILYVTVKTRFH